MESDGDEVDAGQTAGGRAESSGDADPNSDLVARRDAMKKAAAGAAVAGAVWSAPKVVGLHVVPDFASAGTLTATTTANVTLTAFVPPGNPDYWVNAGSNAATGSAPIPTFGNVVVTLPPGTRSDNNAAIPFTVSFAGWDPPFNRILGANLDIKTRGPGTSFTPYGPFPLGSIAPAAVGPTPTSAFPAPTFSPLTFSIPQGANDQGYSPGADAQWHQLSFTFSFGPA